MLVALNCSPCSLSLIYEPSATSHSPAVTEGSDPMTVASSRCPRAFTRSTQKPLSSLWKVTRSITPEISSVAMPVLAVGGEKSFGPLQAVIMRHVATNVQEAVVAGSGHWLMEERPAYTVTLIRNFLDSPQVAPTSSARTTSNDLGEKRLTPAEYEFPQHGNSGDRQFRVGGNSDCSAQR
jgi:hypothetical protein